MLHSEFKGKPYEAGFQYGKLMLDGGNSLNQNHILNLSEEKLAFGRDCLPIYEREYPEIVEEVRGIADGLQMKFDELAAFLFGIYNFTLDARCTCFACKRDGQVIFGRNSDFAVMLEPFYESCYYELDGGYSFIGNTTAIVQMEDGVNEYGLAVGLTFIYPKVRKPGFNAGMLVRYLLEKCRDVKEALAALERLPVSSSQTITVADKSGRMAVVECNALERTVILPREGGEFVATANDFNSQAMQKYRCPMPDDLNSGERYRTAVRALGECREYSLEFARDLLSGKYGFMCQYDRSKGADTVWSSIYLLSGGRAYRCEGNPSREPYKEDIRLKFR